MEMQVGTKVRVALPPHPYSGTPQYFYGEISQMFESGIIFVMDEDGDEWPTFVEDLSIRGLVNV